MSENDNDKILNRKQRLLAELERIVDVLIEQYQPEKIILFGSLAKGQLSEWSDLDLAIIKRTKRRFLDRLIDVALLTMPVIGVDFIVYTPEEIEKAQRENRYFIVDEILGSGKVLYEKGEKYAF